MPITMNSVWNRPILSDSVPKPKRPAALATAKMLTIMAPVAASMPACVWPTRDAVPSMNTPVHAVSANTMTMIQKSGVFIISGVV